MLNTAAQKTRVEKRDKYKMKIRTIKKKHLIDEELKTNRVPKELEDYASAKVFSKESFDGIEETEISIVTVGRVELTEDQHLILKKHPKFALPENLKLEDLELDFELSFGKYRYQLQREIREKKERDKESEKTGVGGGEPEKTPEEKQKQMSEQTEIQTSLVIEPASHEREDHRSEQTERQTCQVV